MDEIQYSWVAGDYTVITANARAVFSPEGPFKLITIDPGS